MTQTTKRLDAADRTVLFYGLLAALLGLGLHFVAIHRYRPWDQPFTMVFLLQLAWLAPLAGALLSGMRSGARWLIALAAYVLVLPLLAAYGLGWDAKNMLAVVSDSQRPMLITFLIGAAGFVLLPLVQELDPRQPQWNYPAVFRAAWRNTVHLALAVCLSISVFVLLWIAGMMFRMIGINTVLDVLGHARFHIAAWPIVLAISLVGVRRRPQIADTLRRSWLTLNAWLLPLVALVGLAFTIALAARMALGFEAVKLSAGALIAFCALWIKLINAAWQDSPGAAPFGQGLSRTLRMAMLCLLPLAAVALYGLGLRVGQYGWTIPRVWALYCGGLLALYALGYACRAAARGLLRHAGDDQPRGRLRHAGPAGAGADARGRPAPHRRAKPASGPAGRPPGTARIPLQQHAQRPRPLGARCPAPAGRRRRQQARSAHRTGGGKRADRQVLLLGRTQDRPDRRVAHL